MSRLCVIKTARRHFARAGRLHCGPHFRVEYAKAKSKLGFLFRDVYSRSLDEAIRAELRGLKGAIADQMLFGVGAMKLATDRDKNSGDIYTVPVKFGPDDE